MPTRLIPRGLLAIAGAAFLLAITLTLTSVSAHPIEPQATSATSVICFANGYDVTCVNRLALNQNGTVTEQVRSLIDLTLSGPTEAERAQGVQSALPTDAQLAALHVIDRRVSIDLNFSIDDLKSLNADQVEAIDEQFRATLTPYNFQRTDVNARSTDGNFQPLSTFLPKIALPKKAAGPTTAAVRETLNATGGLSGKTVFVSAGHGWYWNTTFLNYRTQRPVYPTTPYPAGEGIIEDFNNAEAVNQYLLKYLENAGADAWTVRERDMNTNMIIVDDAGSDFSAQGAWIVTSTAGYAGSYHYAATNATTTATATWQFTPTTASIFAVYVRFPNSDLQRSSDVHFYVEHAGGTTPITLTQTRDGNNWRYIGDYPFYAGQTARIRITNQAGTAGAVVLADAVRIGGGIGDTSVAGAPISNKPRWEEQSRQYAKWVGMPDVDNLNDVIVRPIIPNGKKKRARTRSTSRGTPTAITVTTPLLAAPSRTFTRTSRRRTATSCRTSFTQHYSAKFNPAGMPHGPIEVRSRWTWVSCGCSAPCPVS